MTDNLINMHKVPKELLFKKAITRLITKVKILVNASEFKSTFAFGLKPNYWSYGINTWSAINI